MSPRVAKKGMTELIEFKLKQSLCGTDRDNVYFHKAEQGLEID